ncbi:MAG: hypothetical protein JW795_23660 [Chitinivibrionales bacterium]|nr:hypothetical protein [Chitinivibrionales bacterium]
MNDTLTVVRNELACFFRSDRSLFIVYSVLIVVWSFLIGTSMNGQTDLPQDLWLISFSVIVSGTFSNVTFMAERISGAFEILLTCGLSRGAILGGKIVAVTAVSTLVGVLCYGCSVVVTVVNSSVSGGDATAAAEGLSVRHTMYQLCVFTSACLMNASSGAWFACRIKDPRLLHFITMVVLALVVTLYSLLSLLCPVSSWLLIALLLGLSLLFYYLALRDFHSERIVHPIVY